MKKKNLKSLKLNKKSISNLMGGRFSNNSTFLSNFIPNCENPSVLDTPTCMSQLGCTTGPDETMTCANWSCDCDR